MTITACSDLAYLHREFGADALLDYFNVEARHDPDEIKEKLRLYLVAVFKEKKSFKSAPVDEDIEKWEISETPDSPNSD